MVSKSMSIVRKHLMIELPCVCCGKLMPAYEGYVCASCGRKGE